MVQFSIVLNKYPMQDTSTTKCFSRSIMYCWYSVFSIYLFITLGITVGIAGFSWFQYIQTQFLHVLYWGFSASGICLVFYCVLLHLHFKKVLVYTCNTMCGFSVICTAWSVRCTRQSVAATSSSTRWGRRWRRGRKQQTGRRKR